MYIWINFVFKLNLIIYIFARATYSGVSCAKTIVLATATRKSCVLPRAKLDFCFSTAQRIFAIKTRRTKPPAAISQDYLLGGCAFGASGILFIAEATATRKSCVLPRAKLDFCFANRAENLRYQFKQGQKLPPQFRQIICLVGAPLAQAEYCSPPRQRQHASLACCREPNLIFAFLPRRESLLSKQDGQNLLPQFRKIICLVGAPLAQAVKRTLIQGVLINGMCNFEDGTRAARRREYERRA